MSQAVKLLSARALGDCCEVTWDDGGERKLFPWLWLRENCRCPECYNAATRQREVHTAALPADIVGTEAGIDPEGAALEVTWSHGGHQSRYDAGFLYEMRAPQNGAAGRGGPRVAWDAATIEPQLPALPMERVMAEDGDGLLDCLEAIERFGLCLVTGVPATLEDTRAVVERVGYIRETIFGGLWAFSAEMTEHSDSAYSTQALRPHTDGTYSHDAPGLQVFHCLETAGEGGESILVDGLRIAETLRRVEPAAFRLLSEVEVTGRYIEAGVHLSASRPILRLDRAGEVVQVSFNNYDRAPSRPDDARWRDFYGALRAFDRLANDPAMQLKRLLRPDEVLFIDNWRVMHARAAYSGTRRMAGCYLNREDFESKLRVLRAAR